MSKYELDEAALLFGREAARHGDWTDQKRQAAIELFEAVATLDDRQPNFVITCEAGDPEDSQQPPTLLFDLGDTRVRVTYASDMFGAFSEDGQRQIDFELEFNGCLRVFESTQEVAGKRRAAAVVLIEAVLANLRG